MQSTGVDGGFVSATVALTFGGRGERCMGMMRWPLVAAITVGLAGAAAMGAAQTAAPIYKDPRQPIEARVNDLMSRMTLDEKVAQLETVWESKAKLQTADGHFSPELAAKNFPNGICGFARPSDYRRSVQ